MSYLITKAIEIDMGHRIPTHGGKCRSLHGHRWKIVAALRSEVLASSGVETGMVADFSNLKASMMNVIDAQFDHAFVFSKDDPMISVAPPTAPVNATVRVAGHPAGGYGGDIQVAFGEDELYGRFAVVPFSPTSENMARLWFYMLRGVPALHLALAWVEVHETPSCVARYTP